VLASTVSLSQPCLNGHVMLGSLLRRVPLQIRLLSTASPASLAEWKRQYFTSSPDSSLNTWLVSNIGQFRDNEVGEVLRAFRMNESAPIDPALAIVLENELEARVRVNWQNWRLLYQAAKVYRKMNKAGVDLIPLVSEVVKTHLSVAFLHRATLPQAAFILLTLSKLKSESWGVKPEFTTVTGESVFEIAKRVFPARFKNYHQDEMGYWFMILSSAVTQNWGSEEFLKSVEEKIMPGISQLPVPSLIELAATYSHRKCDDYQYLQECFQKPYHRELERSALSIGPKLISKVFTDLSMPKSLPFYYDEQFAEFLLRVVRERSWCQDRETLLNLTFTVLQLATRIGLSSPELMKEIRHTLTLRTNLLSLSKLPHFARHYSMFNIQDDHFWNMFSLNLPHMLAKPSNKLTLFSTILNLSVYNKEKHKKCTEMPEMQQQIESLKAARPTQLRHYWEHWISQAPCKAVEGYLTRSGLEFVKGHYDDFYIDFAFPKQKLAVDICAEQHFVLPALHLCGQKKAKKAILESKGWHYEVLPLLNRPTDAVVEARAKEFFTPRITQ